MPKITVTAGDREWPVEVSSNGYFNAEIDGEAIRDVTLDGLREKAKATVKRNRLHIQRACAIVRAGVVEQIVLRGRSLRDRREILIDNADGKPAPAINVGTVCYRPLSPEEVAEHARLYAAKVEACRQYDMWLKARLAGENEYHSTADDLVKAEIAAAMRAREATV